MTSANRLQPIAHVIGLLLVGLSAVMLVPAAVDLVAGHADWQVFLVSAGVTCFIGVLTTIASRGADPRIDRWQGFLLTTLSWVVVVLFGALPFMFAAEGLSFTDAVFESMSGFTTTGATVITGLDFYPPGLLLWRSLSNWVGGIGIVVMVMMMLPFLRTGGMQLFQTESSDKSGKLFPRAVDFAKRIVVAYGLLTLLCAIAYGMAGMGTFDAVNHAMTTLATGGFSTKDASFAFYEEAAIHSVGVVFMAAGALPLVYYVRVAGGGRLLDDPQVWRFLLVLAICIAAMTLWVWLQLGKPPMEALRLAAFNVTSIVTDTGYASADFSAWGSFAVGGFFVFYLIGGCAGSTSGAIKIFRWHVLFMAVRRQMLTLVQPHRVVVSRYGDRAVDEELMGAVISFFFLYIVTLGALSLLCMATGLDPLSSVSAVAESMANAGPGLGQVVGPATNFASIPEAAKWILCFAMLAGRLELLTVFVVLTPGYWRRS